MATIPLLIAEDIELGELPNYDEAVNGKKSGQCGHPTQQSATARTFFPDFFHSDFGKTAAVDIGTVALANVAIRLGFLRKVLGILSFQLLTTAIFCLALYVTPEIRLFLQQQSWIVLMSIIGSIILLFAMFINAHSVPLNYILLVVWTVMQSVTVGTVVSFFEVKVVIEAVGLTALIVCTLFAYTLQSKRDFQSHWAALFSVSMVFMVACFIQLFLQSALFDFAMAVFGAILFSVYLVFDIDRIMYYSSPEDYIEACVMLYLDIINIFLRILQIVNEANRN